MANRQRWKVLALAIMLSPCRFSCGDDPTSIKWLNDYNEARVAGIEQGRPLLLYVTTDGCHYCDKMEVKTFADNQVINDLHQRFVAAKVNLDPDSDLSKKLMINIFPTTIIISPQGKVLDYARGYLSPEDLQRRMVDAVVQQNVLASRP